MRRLLLAAATLLAVITVIAVITDAAPALAAPSGGAISGVVRNGTTEQPVADVALRLLFIGSQGPEFVTDGRTDAHGRFAFRGLTDGRYLVQVTHQGVSYAAHAVVSGSAPAESVLQVFDVSDRVPLRIAMLGLAVDVQPGYVRISEVVHLQNATSQTFLGTLVFPLPRGTRYITYHEGLHQPKVEGDQITDRLIVRPGAHQAAYSYTVAGAGEIALDRQMPLPIERIELFTTAPAEVRSPRLQPAPTVVTEGRTYTRASGRALPAGTLALTVVGVPAPAHWVAPAAAGTLAGLLLLGLAGAILSASRGAVK